MKKNFLVSLALVLGLGLTGFATNANAQNVKDTTFTFTFSNNGGTSMTAAREKHNSTPAYMKFQWINDGASSYNVKVVDSDGDDFSRTWWSRYFSEYTPEGTEVWISSYAYEDRGYGVNVRLKAYGGKGTVSSGRWQSGGLWSPDSVKRG